MRAPQPTVQQNEKLGKARAIGGQFAPGVLQPGARPFRKGESGNPKGRPRASRTVREHLTTFASYTVPQLDAIVRNDAETIARRGAALAWLRVMRGKRAFMDGKMPTPPALARILDAIDGRRPPKLPRSKWVREVLRARADIAAGKPVVTRNLISIG